MMKFLLVLSLATSTLGSPLPQLDSLNTNQTWSAWAQDQQAELTQTLREGQDQVVQGWQWLQEFLPRKVSLYVEGTAEDGQTLLEDLYAETRKSIVEKTSGNVDDITGLVETFIEKLENIRASAVDIVTQEEPLSGQQIEAKNVQEDLEGTKDELKKLTEEVAKEKQEDGQYEGLEGMLQRLITSAREVLTEVNSQSDLFWSKVKQMEVEVYRVNQVMAQTSGDLKNVLKDLFETLNKELRDASPALKEILDKVEQPREG